MPRTSWAHGRECLCDKCEKRRKYFRAYYAKHKAGILRKNRKWAKENSKRVTKTDHQAYLLRKETIIARHGQDFWKKIGEKGRDKLAELVEKGEVTVGFQKKEKSAEDVLSTLEKKFKKTQPIG